MIFNGTRVEGSLIGGTKLTQEMLEFCAKHSIAPDVKIIPASKAEGVLKGFQAGAGGPVRHVIDIATIKDVAEYDDTYVAPPAGAVLADTPTTTPTTDNNTRGWISYLS